MERKLPGLTHRSTKNQERDENGTRPKHGEACTFQTSVAAIIKKKRPTAVVEPQHAKEKSHVPNTSRDKRFFCSGRSARSLNPKPYEQIGRQTNQLPANEQ